MSPFITASSGAPYNITTGRDTNGDSITAERPSIVALGAEQCTGCDLYSVTFGCFNLNPAAGTSIGRNYARSGSVQHVDAIVADVDHRRPW